MATGKIPQQKKFDYATGQLALADGIDGILQNTVCYRVGNAVNIGGNIVSIADGTSADRAFLVIPSGFRPVAITKCIISFMDPSNVFRSVMGTIYPSGSFEIHYSASYNMKRIEFAATYAIQ